MYFNLQCIRFLLYIYIVLFRFACLTCREDYKGRRGAHRTNLFDVLIKDLIKRKMISNKVLKLSDFDNLVHMAHNRVVWGSMKNV